MYEMPKGSGGKTTPAMRAEFVERYKAGEGLVEIAVAYKTSVPTVRRYLLEAEVPMRRIGMRSPKQESLRLADRERLTPHILALRTKKWPIRRIARKLNTHENLVSEVLREHNDTLKIVHRVLTPAQCRTIRRRYEKGERAYHLAEEFGVSDKTIARAIRRAGGETVGRNNWRRT